MTEKSWRQIVDKYYPAGSRLRDVFMSHSRSVADLALELNASNGLPLDPEEVETAAMLHDIGIFLTDAPGIACRGEEPYIRHGLLGADLLRREGFEEKYARVCERHTGSGLTPEEIESKKLPLPSDRSYLPSSPLERLICYADKFYSKSGDGGRKPLGQVEREMRRHGEESLRRFRSLWPCQTEK